MLATPRKFQVYTEKNLFDISNLRGIKKELLEEMSIVSRVLPFRVNNFVIDELIDWNNIPDDPIFQLTFPQRDMLTSNHYQRIHDALRKKSTTDAALKEIIYQIRNELNPHPADQQTLNVPLLNGKPLSGVQHKYRETLLFFPSQGQTCHSYCTFCFRWAQFIGIKELKFSSNEMQPILEYLEIHKNISDFLVTGGDPLVAKTRHLAGYLEPLLDHKYDHIRNIRIGTKSLTYWPHRFTDDVDADDLLKLFERLVKNGKHLSIMAHYNHWQELTPDISKKAVQKILATGANIRSQGPLLAHVNDNSETWSRLWTAQVSLGISPYYMFVERDTGARHYFEIPLEKCWQIYRDASKNISGLCKTAKGPSMSASPGKIEIQGIAEIYGEKVFVLRFIQARNPEWLQIPFFAKYDPNVSWFDQLKPAFNQDLFFFQKDVNESITNSRI